jgi:glycosyltransferase involved in cell wall biosynthesis
MDHTDVQMQLRQADANVGLLGADVTVGIPTRNRAQLLRQAIESVLAQSHRSFRLVISDNASEDATADVVRAFRDPRIVYSPVQTNVGRAENFNRLVALADTDFVLLLGDDDKLHPDHLARTLEALERHPRVGVVHTGFSLIDESGNVLEPHVPANHSRDAIVLEPGARFIERSMRSTPKVCFSSVVFRKAAFLGAGKLQAEDGLIDDFPLFMRIATRWDFAYVDSSLAEMRAHGGAQSSPLGSFTPRGYRTSRSVPDELYARRLRFLAGADLPQSDVQRLIRAARRTHRHDVVAHLSMCATTGDGLLVTLRSLGGEMRRDRRLIVDRRTWRFVGGQLGGRWFRDVARRALVS